MMPRHARSRGRCLRRGRFTMEPLGKQALLDPAGKPRSPRIQGALQQIRPRLRARFPALDDDVLLTQVLEEAGQRIEVQERESGEVNSLGGYAWKTVLNVALSRLRHSSMRLTQETLGSE